MSYRHSRLVLAAVAVALLLGACDKPAPPPPPPVKAAPPPPPAVDAQVQRRASEVFVFGYPLVLMSVTRDVMTAKTPINTFAHDRSLPEPGAGRETDANGDVLFSRAWLDVSKEPVVLSVPDFHGRYYLIALIDAWTDVFTSIGTRTIGTGKQNYAIVGPGWKGKLPDNVSEIRSPSGMVWMVGRIAVAGPDDVAAVVKVQDEIGLVTLSQWQKPPARKSRAKKSRSKSKSPPPPEPPPPPPPPPAGVDVTTDPVAQVAAMDAPTFFSRFAALLPENPLRKQDAPMAEKIRELGIVPGQPFATDKLEPPAARAVDAGMKTVYATMVSATRGALGDLRNGWTIWADTGRYGTDYGTRAVMALVGLGANAPEDAVFATTRLDGAGKPLDGAGRYVLHFDKGAAPPTDAFWSLSMYDAAHLLVANPMDRYRIGDRDSLKTNADGSLDVYIGNESPGKDKEANWLPAPKGEFNLALRIYWPKPDVIARRWAPPGIRLLP